MRIWIHAITILRLTHTKSNKYVGTPGKQAIKKCSFALIPLGMCFWQRFILRVAMRDYLTGVQIKQLTHLCYVYSRLHMLRVQRYERVVIK